MKAACLIYTTSLVFTCYMKVTDASTYQLNYDGIVSPQHLHSDPKNPISSIPIELAQSLSLGIGGAITEINPSDLQNNIECRSQKTSGTSEIPNDLTCSLDFAEVELSMKMTLSISFGNNINDLLIIDDVLLSGAGLTVILTTPDTLGESMLANAIPKINDVLFPSELSAPASPVWSIQARPSPMELLKIHKEMSSMEIPTVESKNTAYYNFIDTSTLESSILSNPLISNKQLVAQSNDGKAQVWQYSNPGRSESKSTTTALFLESKLQYTTEFAGSAHAEAFIHPALISHPKPSTVAVISDTPLALVREILKHKTVETVIVFTLPEILDLAVSSFSELNNDCSSFGLGKCLDSDRVSIVDVAIYAGGTCEQTHNGSKIEEMTFDAIFMGGEKLHYDTMNDVFDMVTHGPNAIVVVNSGSMPSQDVFIQEEITEEDHRANYLRRVTRVYEKGGHEEATVHIYDEPNAVPLESTFIMVTSGDVIESKTYRRFMRKNPAVIDLDITHNMHSSSTSYINTVHYDGPTHLTYLRPSRAWEWWTCHKNPWKHMDSCSNFLPKYLNINYHVDQLDVVVDPIKGRTTKALYDIPAGHLILPHDSSVSLFFDDQHYEYLHKFVKEVPSALLYKQMLDVIDGYGFQVSTQGFGGFVCSMANNTFMNHACTEDVMNAGPMETLPFDEDGSYTTFFDPLSARRSETFGVHTVAFRDIKKGEEILMDYKHLRDNGMVRESETGMCSGEGIIPIDQGKNLAVGHHGSIDKE